LARGGADQFEIVTFGEERWGNYNRMLLSDVLNGSHEESEIFLNPHHPFVRRAFPGCVVGPTSTRCVTKCSLGWSTALTGVKHWATRSLNCLKTESLSVCQRRGFRRSESPSPHSYRSATTSR